MDEKKILDKLDEFFTGKVKSSINENMLEEVFSILQDVNIILKESEEEMDSDDTDYTNDDDDDDDDFSLDDDDLNMDNIDDQDIDDEDDDDYDIDDIRTDMKEALDLYVESLYGVDEEVKNEKYITLIKEYCKGVKKLKKLSVKNESVRSKIKDHFKKHGDTYKRAAAGAVVGALYGSAMGYAAKKGAENDARKSGQRGANPTPNKKHMSPDEFESRRRYAAQHNGEERPW